MRAGFPAWQQFNQRANFINPSAILRSGTSGTRYTRGRGRPGERRRRTKTGGFAATISLMPGSSWHGRRFFIGNVARARDLSRKTSRKTFQTSCLSSRPIANIWARLPVYLARTSVCVYTLFVPPQYRPDTRISCTRQPFMVGTSERRRCARPLSSSPCPLWSTPATNPDFRR